MSRTLIAMGGYPDEAMVDYVLAHARGARILVDTTASPQLEEDIPLRGEVTTLSFYPWPPQGLRELALGSDVIFVCGGNTANMLAVWRTHGFDRILRDAWDSGILLAGWSAGMICWFDAGVTDSFGPHLEGMHDGLGFIPGSACPHYDGEGRRKPVYAELTADGFPAGLALDDAAAARYDGPELQEVVSVQPGKGGYIVSRDGETPLPVRLLQS